MAEQDKLKDKLLKGLGSVVNLQIVTYVGKVKPTLASDGANTLSAKFAPSTGADDFALVTQINLVEGDIINIVPPDANDADKQWLQNYHLEQVKAGKDIVSHNVKMIREMLENFTKITEPKA
jgi:hypothetical protein